MGAPDLRQQRITVEATDRGTADRMWARTSSGQHRRPACFDHAFSATCATHGCVLGQFQRMARHAEDRATGAGTMARTSGALAQAGDALRAASCSTCSTSGKSTPRSRGGGDHAAQRSCTQPVLHLLAQRRIQRTWCSASVSCCSGQTDASADATVLPVHGCWLKCRLLRACINASSTRGSWARPGARPGKAFTGFGQQAAHRGRTGRTPCTIGASGCPGSSSTSRASSRLPSVADSPHS